MSRLRCSYHLCLHSKSTSLSLKPLRNYSSKVSDMSQVSYSVEAWARRLVESQPLLSHLTEGWWLKPLAMGTF